MQNPKSMYRPVNCNALNDDNILTYYCPDYQEPGYLFNSAFLIDYVSNLSIMFASVCIETLVNEKFSWLK
jgi:hypothetical protein